MNGIHSIYTVFDVTLASSTVITTSHFCFFVWFSVVSYTFVVYTGSQRNAGTDANVVIVLVHTPKYSTGALQLNNKGHNDFERGA